MPRTDTSRCADINQRIQLGEALSNADREILRSKCGR
jgi:hypothetical protein